MNIPSAHGLGGFPAARTRTGWTALTAAEITNLEITLVINQRGLQNAADVRALVDEIMRSRKPATSFLDPRKPLNEPDQARRLICEAFSANGRKRAKLAERALKIWPLCADAYLLLAVEEEGEIREQVLEEGLSVAAKALADSYDEATVEALLGDVEDDEEPLEDRPLKQLKQEVAAINFWTDPTTRPYIRLLVELAKTYHELSEPPVLYLTYLRRALRLCPNDNIGARYLLAPFLMELVVQDRAYLEELGVLLKRYASENSTEWLYNRVWYQCEKDELSAARVTLDQAFDSNQWVPAIMTGVVEPRPIPEHLIPGSQEEAADYCLWNLDAWNGSTQAKLEMFQWFIQWAGQVTGESKIPSKS